MKDNLANRLAAGGVWAILMAWQAARATEELRERGMTVPIGDGSLPQVFVLCGIDGFQFFCNYGILAGQQGKITADVRAMTRETVLYNRHGQRITVDEWNRLHSDDSYTHVAHWVSADGSTVVETRWVGYDENPCATPHIFHTIVVRQLPSGPAVVAVGKYANNHDALVNHHRICAMVRMGKL